MVRKRKSTEIPTLSRRNIEKVSCVTHVKNELYTHSKTVPFTLVAQSNNDNLIDYYLHNTFKNIRSNYNFTLVNDSDVIKIIKNIKTNAMGTDGINNVMLKYCCPFVIPFITHIINSCLVMNTFPSKWKEACVIPVPKITNPVELKDLRPVSILPTLSKILEKVICKQLVSHLNKYNILPINQSGFRQGHSCTTALMKVSDDILEECDSGNITALVLLDFSKAFDTLQHKLLVSILHFVGLGKDAIKLLTDYLSYRTQKVKFNSNISKSLLLTTGVPQGSILGPLLFSIYTSNFCNKVIHSNFHMYADDTQLYLSFKKEHKEAASRKLIHDLNIIAKLSHDHLLFLNPNKSKVMLFGSKAVVADLSENFVITIGNTIIPIVDNASNLGLIFDNTFRFRSQVSKYLQRSYAGLKMLYPHRNYLSIKVKTMLCESLVLSTFSYCAAIYYPCLDVLSKGRIQRVQNSCARFIFGIRRREHISHKIKELKWLNMENKLKLYTLCCYHQILCKRTPIYLYNKIKFRTDVHNINIRNKHFITIPTHRTALYERSFTYNIAKTYNDIPDNVKNLKYRDFKKHISSLLSNDSYL